MSEDLIEVNKKKLKDAINTQLLLENSIGKIIHVAYIDTSSIEPEIIEVTAELVSLHRFDRIVVSDGESFHYIEFAGPHNLISFIEDEQGKKVFGNPELYKYISGMKGTGTPPSSIKRIRTYLFGEETIGAEEKYRNETCFRFGQNVIGEDGWKVIEKYLEEEYIETWKTSWDDNGLIKRK